MKGTGLRNPLHAEIRGAEQLLLKLRGIFKLSPDVFAEALRIETEIEATECKRRCPVDVDTSHGRKPPHPGNLRNSIHTEGPERQGRLLRMFIATGAQAPYGIYVHENLYAFHMVGEAKFIEGPILESRPYMAGRVAARIRQIGLM